MPKSPDEMKAAILKNLPRKTGRGIEEWRKLLASPEVPDGEKERIAWLKAEYGVGTITARMIVLEVSGGTHGYERPDELVDAMYSGKRAALRPIYDALAKAARKVAKDVDVSARKTYVALRKNRVFAVIQPTTQTRVDLGLALAGEVATDRLEPVKRLGNDRITHRIALTDAKQVDAEVRRRLKQAYELGG
jgi:predicted transport protein